MYKARGSHCFAKKNVAFSIAKYGIFHTFLQRTYPLLFVMRATGGAAVNLQLDATVNETLRRVVVSIVRTNPADG